MWWMPASNAGPRVVSRNSTTHYCVERADHSVMTHPSKSDWDKPYGITHRAQQWDDSEQEINNSGIVHHVMI